MLLPAQGGAPERAPGQPSSARAEGRVAASTWPCARVFSGSAGHLLCSLFPRGDWVLPTPASRAAGPWPRGLFSSMLQVSVCKGPRARGEESAGTQPLQGAPPLPRHLVLKN